MCPVNPAVTEAVQQKLEELRKLNPTKEDRGKGCIGCGSPAGVCPPKGRCPSPGTIRVAVAAMLGLSPVCEAWIARKVQQGKFKLDSDLKWLTKQVSMDSKITGSGMCAVFEHFAPIQRKDE